MSSKALPRGNKYQKPSHLVHQNDGGLEVVEGPSVSASDVARDGDRESETIRKKLVIAQRMSQLPQRSPIRKISMQTPSSRDATLSGSTRDSLCEPISELIVGRSNAMSKQQRAIEQSSRRNTNLMLPPSKPGRSVSTQSQDSNSARSQIGIQRSASTRSGSQKGAPRLAPSRSSSQGRLLGTGIAKPSQNIAVHQADQLFNASSTSDAPRIGLAIAEHHNNGNDRTYGHARYNPELNPTLPEEVISRHNRSRSQLVSKSAPSDIVTLPTEIVTRRPSGLYHHRPPFSTLQQHFSPKKTLKSPPAPFSLQSTSKHGASHELSNETAQIQTELIQLHLLLCSAADVQHLWEKSAEQSLQSRFELLREKRVELDGLVRSHQASVNHSTLMAWCDDMSRTKLAEKLQLLSHTTMEISALVGSGGRYTLVLSSFDPWFVKACRIRGSRNTSFDTVGQDLEFIDDIGDDWKLEVASLEMKLASYFRELRNVDKPHENSNLARFILLFQKLVANLLDELDVIRGIECDLMAEETLWIEGAIGETSLNVDDRIKPFSSSSYQGIWHATV